MELTVQLLRDWFGQFNARYFGGELPEPRLAVNKSRRLLGQFSCKKVRKGLFRGYKTVGYTIKVSEYYDLSMHEYQSTLLHAIRQQPSDAQYLLLVLKTRDGKHFLSVVNPSYRTYIERQISLSSVIIDYHWLVSRDTRYAHWVRVRSLRGKRITETEYHTLLTK